MAFLVTITEGKSATRHQVTMSQAAWRQLAGGRVPAARCIEAAFRFLLDHEPKESILRRFDVTIIGGYFPSFERELVNYIQSIEHK